MRLPRNTVKPFVVENCRGLGHCEVAAVNCRRPSLSPRACPQFRKSL